MDDTISIEDSYYTAKENVSSTDHVSFEALECLELISDDDDENVLTSDDVNMPRVTRSPFEDTNFMKVDNTPLDDSAATASLTVEYIDESLSDSEELKPNIHNNTVSFILSNEVDDPSMTSTPLLIHEYKMCKYKFGEYNPRQLIDVLRDPNPRGPCCSKLAANDDLKI